MQNLNVLTNNHLGTEFWEQRTGLQLTIEFYKLSSSTFQELLNKNKDFILIDFYFSNISMNDELKMIHQIRHLADRKQGQLKLFILSPLYSNNPIEQKSKDNNLIVTHNFSMSFLRTLLKTGKKINIQTQY